MPRLAIDYSKTIMYRIVCKDPTITDCYVGSTTDFKSRKSAHKGNCNNEKSKKYNIYVYKFIRDNGGWDNFDMIEIEKYNAKDKPEQSKRERYWLETYGATLNTFIPSRTDAEYYIENIDKIAEYREQNKDKMAEYQKEYRIENKVIILEKNKKYYEENKEHKKEYREQNKEKFKEKMTCSCGSICRKKEISRHLKSKKHLNYIISLNI